MSSKKERRHKAIIEHLTAEPTMRVRALAEALEVTTETIRRDLDDLTEKDLISRTYGGAMLRQPREAALSDRHNDMPRERQAIARAACELFRDARTLMMGSGATTTHVARRIAYEINNITVITHSFGVATALSFNPTITVIMTPGLYHSGEGAMHGAQTVRFLADFSADWAIVGASGLSPDGPSDALIEAADVYATMLLRAERRMIVADHSKFGRLSTARYARWSHIDAVVTDQQPAGPLADALKADEVDLRLASV